MKTRNLQQFVGGAVLLLSMAVAPNAFAHGGKSQAEKKPVPHTIEETAFGRQGDPARVDRVIAIDMNDRMRFAPEHLVVRQGETIRFVVNNSGKILHEMVLGTMPELKAHQQMMAKHPGMEHEEPYSVHVDAAKQGEMVWQFSKAGDFYYGCLIPGHFEAGMIGKVTVKKG